MPALVSSPVVDNHAHIHLCDSPADTIIRAAHDNGVPYFFNVSTDVPSAQICVDLAEAHPEIFAVIGIHPNDSDTATPENLAAIERLAAHPKVVGFGETGIDLYRLGAPYAVQRASFEAHIDMAKRHGKTLVIHDRDAHDEVVDTLLAVGPPDKVVFHCFSGGADLASICAEHDWYISYAGNVTFKNALLLQEGALVAPEHLILVETDSPFMTPVPYRGRPNDPSFVPNTLTFLADHKGLDREAFAAQVFANTQAAFPGFGAHIAGDQHG